MTSVGEFLVHAANKRGIVMFVESGRVRYFPRTRMSEGLLRVLVKYREQVLAWLVGDAVTGEDVNG